jgi:hypothetical protein
MILKETSLVLCAFALLGLLLAALAYRAGTRGGSLVAALLCAITVAVSLVPMAQAEGWPPPRTLRFRCPGTSRAPLRGGTPAGDRDLRTPRGRGTEARRLAPAR